MSRLRNRNIRNKFHVPSKMPEKPQSTITADSGIDVKPVGFGSVINKQFNSYNTYAKNLWGQISSVSSCGSSDLDLIERDHIKKEESFDKSSTSSLSWAEDYEIQATVLVKEEYERMERVLQCLEVIPSHYDKDEYRLWIKTFPCLSLTGQSTSRLSDKSSKSILSKSPEFKKPERLKIKKKNCDKSTSAVSGLERSKNLSKLTVIDKLLDDLYPSQQNSHRKSYTTYSNDKELAVNNTLNPRTLNLKFDSFLQIAPVSLPKKSDDDVRQVANARTASWLQDLEVQEFRSLPYNTSPRHNLNRRKKYHIKPSAQFIVLPPIETKVNQLRSISATSNRNFFKKSSSEYFFKQPLQESDESDFEIGSNQKLNKKKSIRFIKLDQHNS